MQKFKLVDISRDESDGPDSNKLSIDIRKGETPWHQPNPST
jgi:hypothetical protein